MRLRLVPEQTNFDFFRWARLTFGGSVVAMLAAVACFLLIGLNYGIDFSGGTTIRTDAEVAVDVGSYREALAPLELGDVTITEVFDPSFDDDQHVAMIVIQAQDGEESVGAETIGEVQAALTALEPSVTFPSVESVGPTVSGELITKAVLAVTGALFAIVIYIWLRFEWQFAIGAVAALVHDVVLTIGIFSILQIRFDLAIIAAILTIVGYSINDTVVVFDRARENLIKHKKKPLRDVLNLSANETLSRTLMTSGTTLIALVALLILGGDVLRGFVFAITWGVLVGTYSSIYVAKNVVLMLGVRRDWGNKDPKGGTTFANVDA
ncbi:MAG: protein translocase subunit SecF [Marivivens sp.]|jgi:preprotein translocase subunit SecF|nr:protein translocase subunit SecF [Marivivens sp.]